jgi:hypothetical protein
MKKIFFIVFLLSFAFTYSQETSFEPKNELRLNSFNLIAFKWLDVAYERVLNEESTIGISLITALGDEYTGWESKRNYSITPYYRHFFSDNYAKGFFMEGFAKINGGEREVYYDGGDESIKYSDVAFGIGVGGKFISRRGFVGEINAGLGRNLFNSDAPEVVGRAGISFGYRF